MTVLLLILCANEVLWLNTGQALACDGFERKDDRVLIQRGEQRFTLPDHLVDWAKTEAERERPSREPDPEAANENDDSPERISPGGPQEPRLIIDSLDVKDASIIDLLRFLADRGGVNLVIDGSVPDTKATYYFKHIAWEDALHIVLANASLDYEIHYGTLQVRKLRLK